MKRGGPAVASLAALMLAIAPSAAHGADSLGHSGRWMTDTHGRAVVLRGVAVMDFGPRHLPSAIGFGADDVAFLHAHGYNIVRVGLNWLGLEPSPGTFDQAYLASLVTTVRELAAQGIWSVLDLHQDGWGPAVHGQDGEPDWATLTDGAPNPELAFGQNYFGNPALERAFDNFWGNTAGPGGIGLQDRYASMMARLAAAFRDEPGVLGYEIMNEPWPGSQYATCSQPAGCPAFDSQQLTGFYARVIPAIRAADHERMVFYEPNLFFDFGAQTNLVDPAPADRRTGFTFHDYCLGAGAGSALPVLPGNEQGCPTEEKMVLDYAEGYSKTTGAALLNTEWSATSDLPTVARMASALDAALMSWTYWAYSGAADNSTLVGDATKAPAGSNLHDGVLALIDRPSPREVAGTPTSWSFDTASRAFAFEYATKLPAGAAGAGMPTEVYVPRGQYPAGYAVKVSGASVVSSPTAGRLTLCAAPGAAKVSLGLAPDSGSSTDLPPNPFAAEPACPHAGGSGSSGPPVTGVTGSGPPVRVSHGGTRVSVPGLIDVRMPARRSCARRARFSIAIRRRAGVRILSARLRVNGRRRTVRLSRGLRSSVAVTPLPRGKFRVVLVLRVRAPGGPARTLTVARSYRGC